MAYEPSLLFAQIQNLLWRTPATSLKDLADATGVSMRTVENLVKSRTGKDFRSLRGEILIERFCSVLQDCPGSSLKETAFSLGYSSERSFARVVRRGAGSSPRRLRSRMADGWTTAERHGPQ
jgi:transcriptional regulator GlxA family with amidase domain